MRRFAPAVSLLFKNPTPGGPFLSDLQAIACAWSFLVSMSGRAHQTGLAALKFRFDCLHLQTMKLRVARITSGDLVSCFFVQGASTLPHRVATFSFTHDRHPASAIAQQLSDAGLYCHWGDNYAYEVAKTLDLDKGRAQPVTRTAS